MFDKLFNWFANMDEATAKRLALTIVLVITAILIWLCSNSWETSEKIAATVVCVVVAIAVWWLPFKSARIK